MNQTLEVIRNRFSCRAFTGTMPQDEKINAIAQAAVKSPSSMNRQPWQVIVVHNAELMAELEAEGMRVMADMPDKTLYERIQARGGKLFYNAPCILFIPIDPSELASAALDCGIVCQTIALATKSLGLDSCICGLARLAFTADKGGYFKEKLKFPKGYEFGAAVLIGEAKTVTSPHEPDLGKITHIG